MMLERGIDVSHEAIRLWTLKFGSEYARSLRCNRCGCGDTWHLDEVFLKINGEQVYLWRAVDQDGEVLDILVQKRRIAKAGTIELQGNTYYVDLGLAWPGQIIEVRFDPFDLSKLDLYREGKPLAPVIVVHYKRQFHLQVEKLVPPALRGDPAAGSTFLATLRDEHDASLRKQIGGIQYSLFTEE